MVRIGIGIILALLCCCCVPVHSVTKPAVERISLSNETPTGTLLLAALELQRGNARAVEQLLLPDTTAAALVDRFDALWDLERITRRIDRRTVTSFLMLPVSDRRTTVGFVEFGYLVRLQLELRQWGSRWYLKRIEEDPDQFPLGSSPKLFEQLARSK